MKRDRIPLGMDDKLEDTVISEITRRLSQVDDKKSIASRFNTAHYINEIYPGLMGGLVGYCVKQEVTNLAGNNYEEFGVRDPYPELELIDIGNEDGSEVEVIVQGGYFFEIDSKKFAYIIKKTWDAGSKVAVGVIADAENQDMAVKMLIDLKDRIKFNNFYKNKAIRVSGNNSPTFLRDLNYCPSDIILPPEVWAEIDSNIINFLGSLDIYRAKGLPTKRGVLFEGRPGTGKTLMVKIICSVIDCTRIVVLPDSHWDSDDIYVFYEMASSLAPTIVLWEDIDIAGGEDRDSLTGALLQVLDGPIKLEGVITVATTNRPETLDEALSKRPSRFDRRLEFPLPNPENRLLMLRKFASKLNVDEETLRHIASKADGLTGAALQELVMAAFMRADGNITTADFEKGLEQLRKFKFVESIGFKKERK